MSEMNIDQQLVERVQRGDKNAFNLLVSKYQHKMANLVSRYVSDQGDVADVVQEAFIKAYRALPEFRGESAFYTWLFRIAVNTAKNYLTAQGRRPPELDVDVRMPNSRRGLKPCTSWLHQRVWCSPTRYIAW